MIALRYRLERIGARLHTRFLADVSFVHINKTGGSSVEKALGLPFQHRTALEIRDEIGPRRWAERFSFTIVRNPWDKVVSHYHYRVKTNQTALAIKPVPFREWVHLAYGERDPLYYDKPKMFMPQCDWICDANGQLLVGYVGRFETLEDDFRHVCSVLGRTAALPHLKSSQRGDYRTHYSDAAADLIGRVFAADIERFGYQFG